MKYCVIAKITRHTIEFRYQIDNDSVEILALRDSEQVIPLAFCLNGSELLMGKYALERVACGDPYAYTDYFELIKDSTKVFKYANEDRPIKQILYLGVERYLSFFLREKLLASDGSISSNRPDFPLRFCFSQDITGNERRFVIEQFNAAGYRNVAEIELEKTLFHIVTNNSNRDKLLLTGLNGDLIMSYFNSQTCKSELTKTLSGLGSDPRYKKCIDIIIDYIKSDNPFFDVDIESNMPALMDEARKILQSDQTVMQGNVFFNDGSSYDYEISRLELRQQLSQCDNNQLFLSEVEYLINTQGISNHLLDVIMEESVNTDYFIDKIRNKFPNVYGVTTMQYRQMWAQIFSTIDLNPPKIESPKIPTLPPSPSIPKDSPKSPIAPPTPKVPSTPQVPPTPQRATMPPPPPKAPTAPSRPTPPPAPKIPSPPPVPKVVTKLDTVIGTKTSSSNTNTVSRLGNRTQDNPSLNDVSDTLKEIKDDLKTEMNKVGAKAAKALSLGLGRMKDKLDELNK